MDSVTIFLAKYLIFIIALIAFGFWLSLKRATKLQLAATVIIGGVLAYVLVKIGGALYYHPRPFVTEHIQSLVAHGNDNGFPSEHATYSALAATCVYFYSRKLGYLLAVLAVLVAIGRVGAHVHSPLDVIAGLIIGAVAAVVGYELSRRKLAAKESGQHTLK